MKLANEIIEDLLSMSNEDIKLALEKKLESFDIENIKVDEVSTEFSGDTVVKFVDADGDSELDVLFTFDEEDGAIAVVLEREIEDDEEESELDFVDLDALDPILVSLDNGEKAIDLVNLSWMSESALVAILNIGDFLGDEDEPEAVDERSVAVIRGGKRVKLPVVRRKRRKRLTPKQKAGIRKGVRKRKQKKGAIQRKRKKSLKIRRRTGLKKKDNKRLRTIG